MNGESSDPGHRTVTCRNHFSDEDCARIDWLIYSVGLVRSSPGMSSVSPDGSVIKALGDVSNVPQDYAGSIFSTGSITFAEERVCTAVVGYASGTTDVRAPVAFRKALTIRRSGDDVVVQTDVAEYRLGPRLTPSQARVFSRSPIVVVREAGGIYMACEREGYVFDGSDPLDPGCVYEVAPHKRYGIGTFASLTVE
ncbi:MAG: hypothetical protein Q4Q62_08000 [Thermoplasmata archaeon]|nr:hypothetical protein [Thermoplasmata archaeon]